MEQVTNKVQTIPLNSLLSSEAQKRLTESGINRFITRLLVKMSEIKTTKLGLVFWNDEFSARDAATLLAMSFSDQMQKKCGLVCSEGIKMGVTSHDGYDLIYYPEVVLPEHEAEFKIFQKDIEKRYPVQVILTQGMSNCMNFDSGSFSVAKAAGAQVLLFPVTGVPREGVLKIEAIKNEQQLNLIGSMILSPKE